MPGFQAIPIANRMVPAAPTVSFATAIEVSTTVFNEGGFPSFLLKSIAKDEVKGMFFVPNEAAGTNEVDQSRQTIHGNTGTIYPIPPRSYPSPPLPGAINAGVINSDDVGCLDTLESLIELLAHRLYGELSSNPMKFLSEMKAAEQASNLQWAKDLPGGIWQGAKDTVSGLWGLVKGVGGAIIDANVAFYSDPVAAAQAAADAAAATYNAAVSAFDVITDPAQRDAVIDELKNWLREQTAALGCKAVPVLTEALTADKSLATQMGELKASIDQTTAEVAGQVAITVLGDKGLSKIALVAKGSKLGGLADDIGKLLGRIGERLKGKGTPGHAEPPRKAPVKPKAEPETPPPAKVDGGNKGNAASDACKTGCGATKGKPVNVAYGCKVLFGAEDMDFDLPAVLPLPWQRSYASDNDYSGWLGRGWSIPLSNRIEKQGEHFTLIDEQGRRIELGRVVEGQTKLLRSEQITITGTDNGRVELADPEGGARQIFAPLSIAESCAQGMFEDTLVLIAILDRNLNQIRIGYGDGDQSGLPTTLIDSAGRALTLAFAPLGARGERLDAPAHARGSRLTGITQHGTYANDTGYIPFDALETLVSYLYSSDGDLVEVKNRLNESTRQFAYDDHQMVMHAQPGGVVSHYEYDKLEPTGKVIRNWTDDGREWRFDYLSTEFAPRGLRGSTRITDQLGRVETVYFTEKKHILGQTDALGGRSTRHIDASGLLLGLTDEAGRDTRISLNDDGLPTEITGPDGAAQRISYHTQFKRPTQITDALGNASTYAYDDRGNLASVTDALGNTTRYERDARGLISAIIDATGKRKTLTYNGAGQITRYTDCSEETSTWSYDARGHLQSSTDSLGYATHYEHDAMGRLTALTQADGATERCEYDTLSRLTAHTDAAGSRTFYTLAVDGLPLTRTNALGGALSYAYDSARRLTALQNENRSSYHFHYDALDRLTAEQGFDQTLTRYRYDPTGLPTEKLELGVSAIENGSPDSAHSTSNPGNGRIPSAPRSRGTADDPWGEQGTNGNANTTEPPLCGGAIRTRYLRNAAGRLTQKLVAGRMGEIGAPSQTRTTRYGYDLAGQLTEAINDHGSRITLAYDALGQLMGETSLGTNGAPTSLAHVYDALGNRIQSTLPTGETVNWLYYGSGHLHQINVDGHLISDIERDGLHREIERTQGALTSRYQYDPLGRLTAQNVLCSPSRRAASNASNAAGAANPRPGAWEALGDLRDIANKGQGASVLSRRYRYDPVGNLKEILDQRAGRASQMRSYGYDRIGRITGAKAPNTSERFAFDPAHNLIAPSSGKASSAASSASQGLIKNNRLMVYENKRFKYDTHGNLIEKRIGKHTTIALKWDVEHQLIESIVTRNETTQTTSYAYDAFGRRTHKTDAFGQTRFTWDGNRLLSETRGHRTLTYLYEPDSFAPLAQLEHGSKPHLPQAGEGRGESGGTTLHDEDTENDSTNPRTQRAVVLQSMQHQQRETKAKIAVSFAAARTSSAHKATTQRTQAALTPAERKALAAQYAGLDRAAKPINEQTASKDCGVANPTNKPNSWTVRYFHNDHLGTPRELSNNSGEIEWAATYKAWGNTLKVEYAQLQVSANENAETEEAIHQPIRFQGQYFDNETGLHYNRFRYYDPDVGRFASRDPIGLLGGDNLYQYAPNPTEWLDPLGLNPWRRKNGQFGKKPGPKPMPDESGHGNSKNNPNCATLYKLQNPDGSLSKWGITSKKNPNARYSTSALGDRQLVVIATGPRIDILALERTLTNGYAGPKNLESWAGNAGTSNPDSVIRAYAALRPCVKVIRSP